MKSSIIISVLVLSLFQDSKALICYSCSDCSNSLGTEKNCTDSETSCSKVKGSLLGITTIAKDCSSNCIQGGGSFFGVSGEVFCCNTDLCNYSSKVASGTLILILSVISFYLLKH
ncbi:unnamed protein product [Brachionus calyciflorus]|uniref:Snake toxin/toxin-like domain-containing protein n=1 Tax=Brachionus calyciflorus TaxID=104777 RepID=A0A813QTI5_9BILA|nr:unnamed protein product [Brachionus calyciflorus]